MYFVVNGEVKLFENRDTLLRKVINFPLGLKEEKRPMMKTHNARDFKHGFMMQIAIKGKKEMAGFEEYSKKLSFCIQNCVCESSQTTVYAIKSNV